MLKNAVAKHEAGRPTPNAPTQHRPLSKITSPLPQSTLKPFQQPFASPSGPLSNRSANVPAPGNAGSLAASVRSFSTSGKGIKRTASGLVKALDDDMSFDQEQSLGDPKSHTATAPVFFDEDDFDSDIDLDVEDPATKGTVSYPKLPPVPPTAPETAPVLPTSASDGLECQQRTGREDSGYGSQNSRDHVAHQPPPMSSGQALPWSSSPVEHFKTPPRHADLQAFRYTGQVQDAARPTKRRTLPWLEEQKRIKEETERAEQASSLSDPSRRAQDGGVSNLATPSTKPKKESNHPWNTTASAVKEHQKSLRQANKRLIKTTEATKEAKREAKMRASKDTISRVFLSEEQQHVLELVLKGKKSVFFTGSAGTGKSVLLREIIFALRKEYQRDPERVAVTASTGLAACNVGGVTLHSFAGIGLGKESAEELIKKIKKNQKAKHRWMKTKVLIIDEVSMVDGDMFDKLEHIARTIRNNGRPFGGIQLVITGDFFQLPPVPENKRAAKFAFDAATWNTTIEHTIGLHHVFRQKDPVFANMLNEMREGRLTPESIAKFKTLNRPLSFKDELTATELFPTRQEVERANTLRMSKLDGDIHVYEARDGGAITDPAFRARLLANCMAPERVVLKQGAQVMLIKNIDDTLVNGSLGHIVGFMNEQTFDTHGPDDDIFRAAQSIGDEELNPSERQLKHKLANLTNTAQVWPLVRFSLADGTTRDLLCQREQWKIELPNGEVQASRSQIPLILAWALSIHKAQGQTLERVKVDLGKVFEKGQAYVALSRATSMAGLQVLNFDPRKVVAHERVRSFYASLSRAQDAVGGRSTKKKQGGIAAEDYERDFLDDGFEEGVAMSAY